MSTCSNELKIETTWKCFLIHSTYENYCIYEI